MRYMLAAAILFVDQAGRLVEGFWQLSLLASQTISYCIINGLLFGLFLIDRKNGHDTQPYLVAMSGFLIYELAFYIIFT